MLVAVPHFGYKFDVSSDRLFFLVLTDRLRCIWRDAFEHQYRSESHLCRLDDLLGIGTVRGEEPGVKRTLLLEQEPEGRGGIRRLHAHFVVNGVIFVFGTDVMWGLKQRVHDPFRGQGAVWRCWFFC